VHYEILSHNRMYRCAVELVKAEVIEIKRRASQVFKFRDVGNFVDILTGHSSCVVYVGRDSEDSETWKAYYWEPTIDEAKKAYGWSEGENILPPGSLAILEMQDEYELEWELESRARETRKWLDLWEEIGKLSKKIWNIDDENKYADADKFRFMTTSELEQVLEEMKREYQKLTSRRELQIESRKS